MAWNWETVKDSLVQRATEWTGVLNLRMKALERHLANADELPVHAKVKTTDATVTLLIAEAVPASKTLGVLGFVIGRRTGGSAGTAEDAALYRVEFVAKNAAGTAAVIGEDVTAIGESQAGWDCAVDANSGNVRIRVTGAANNNVTWAWSRLMRQVVANNT